MGPTRPSWGNSPSASNLSRMCRDGVRGGKRFGETLEMRVSPHCSWRVMEQSSTEAASEVRNLLGELGRVNSCRRGAGAPVSTPSQLPPPKRRLAPASSSSSSHRIDAAAAAPAAPKQSNTMSECIAATTSSSERVCGIDTNTCSSCGQRCERDSAASTVESSVPNVIEMATTATEAAFARQFSAHDVAGRQSARPRPH